MVDIYSKKFIRVAKKWRKGWGWDLPSTGLPNQMPARAGTRLVETGSSNQPPACVEETLTSEHPYHLSGFALAESWSQRWSQDANGGTCILDMSALLNEMSPSAWLRFSNYQLHLAIPFFETFNCLFIFFFFSAKKKTNSWRGSSAMPQPLSSIVISR